MAISVSRFWSHTSRITLLADAIAAKQSGTAEERGGGGAAGVEVGGGGGAESL